MDELSVELVGYLSTAVGVGEAARRYVSALRSVGVDVLEHDVPLHERDLARADLLEGRRPSSDAIKVNLMCMNPEQMTPYLSSEKSPPRVGRRTVGIWSWEVDVLPPGWREAALELDEVWTYSSFAARIMEASIQSPVQSVAPPVLVSPIVDKLSMQLPPGFRVLTMFDYLSTLERKNPLGAIEAFKLAFRPSDGAVLIVKSVNGRHRPDRRAEIEAAAGERKDIVLVDQGISGVERDMMIAECDCYLSLHRSEGHGLGLAEAMALGKPVIATAYGGNTEFMQEDNSYLIDWVSTYVGDHVEHYPAGASWAEPDVEHAARVLKLIHEDRADAERRASRARSEVLAYLSPIAAGEQMRERLEQLIAPSRGRLVRRFAERLIGRGHARA